MRTWYVREGVPIQLHVLLHVIEHCKFVLPVGRWGRGSPAFPFNGKGDVNGQEEHDTQGRVVPACNE